MSYEIAALLATVAFGFVAVLIFHPESYWGRMAVGAVTGLLVWLVKVTVIWWSYRA